MTLIDPRPAPPDGQMKGVKVSPPVGAGTFGRFRVIPGSDLVVLVNSVYEPVFIGSVPFEAREGRIP